MPRFVVHLHFHQHVAGEEFAFRNAFLTQFQLNNFFNGNQNSAKYILHSLTLYTFVKGTLHTLFKA